MSDELFPVESITADSPRLAWMKRHDIHTYESPCDCGGEPWSAWTGELQDAMAHGGDNPQAGGYATGATEEDAICALANARGFRLWNEEGATP